MRVIENTWFRIIVMSILALLGPQVISTPVLAEDGEFYQRYVKPVLHERCYACHGSLKQEGDLRLDTALAAVRGGASGTALKAGDPEHSEIWSRITSIDLSTRMPPEGEPLKPDQIEAIRQWISEGAVAPADEAPESDPREHWAFRAPIRPPVPMVNSPEWNENPVDAFIARKHEIKGYTPQPPADPRTWLRRVTLDLTGLPPTPEEQTAFLADNSPQAVQTVVSRLLDSPQYGERWGRHWMDVWRYSDWWGLGPEVRNSQKHIWHWRDWIIESLNKDQGYDQMLREMLAADELYPNDLDKLRATGFLARQYFKFNRTSWLDETIEHTSKAMLGLTFNCGKCHDHKYDPFSQKEYYQLRAFFEPYQVRTEAVPGTVDFEQNGIPRAFDCNLDIQTYLHIRGDDRNLDTSQAMIPAVPSFLSWGDIKIEPVALPPEAIQPGLRPFVVQAHRKALEEKIAIAKSAIAPAQEKLNAAESHAVVEAARMAAAAAVEAVAQASAETATLVAKEAVHSEKQKILVSDKFEVEQPELWEQKVGEWKYDRGCLIQSQTGAQRASLRLKELPPTDFEARLRFHTTGGEKWKSVGISFDMGEQGREVLAYLSCYAEGPLCRVAYRLQGADYVYPSKPVVTGTFAVGELHRLVVRVRGNLVNVMVDDKPAIAYRLPIDRAPGPLEVITYDASAELNWFELKTLPESISLVEDPHNPPPPDTPLALAQAQVTYAIAEKSVIWAEAQLTSLEARSAADHARFQSPQAENIATLISAASLAEKQASLAQADHDASVADLARLTATPEQKPDREAKYVAAKADLEKAQQAVQNPGDTYTSILGALKTMENNLETEESRRKPFPSISTGRRTAFANWITDRQNPLTARVAVNHIWARHFGKPLVPTVFDFGRKGTLPIHPELLDWLAVELMEHGWSMKHIHRLIVTSKTYGMTSSNRGAAVANLTLDPENRFHWRANPIRMEAQIVRDSLLSLAGDLDLTLGGPSVPSREDSRRRSLYFVHSHNEHNKFLSMFDDASVLDCYRRSESVVPQQALALENSPLTDQIAEKIANRIHSASMTSNDEEWIREAFRTILANDPTDEELAISISALVQLTELAKSSSADKAVYVARKQFVQALLNHNDFVTVR